MSDTRMFDGYFESVFKYANTLSNREIREHALLFERNYAACLPVDRKSTILDLGCGVGHFLRFVAEKGYSALYGVDISSQQVEVCRQLVTAQIEVADASSYLKGKVDFFDVIVANDLLEHIPKDALVTVLNDIHRSLRQGGVFLLKTPNAAHPLALYSRYRDFTHTVGLTENSLFQVLWVAGFRHIEVRPLNTPGVLHTLRQRALHLLLRKLYWYQGFTAPRILTSLLVGVARK